MFSLHWCDEDGSQRILGFALPSLVILLFYKIVSPHWCNIWRGSKSFFSDCIFLVMDHVSSMHTSIFYCPMTKKSVEAYNLLWETSFWFLVSEIYLKFCYIDIHESEYFCDLFIFVKYFEGGKGIDVLGIMHDFEWALVNSIERWFHCNYHLGCFFERGGERSPSNVWFSDGNKQKWHWKRDRVHTWYDTWKERFEKVWK